MANTTRTLLLVPLLLATRGHSQTALPNLSDAITSTASIDKKVFKPGETIELHVHLSKPAQRDLQLSATPNCSVMGGFSGTILRGESDVVLKTNVWTEAQSSKCTLTELGVAPPAGPQGGSVIITGSVLRLAKAIEFQIDGIPRVSETLDTSITAELNLSEKQYLRSRSINVSETRQELLSSLSRDARDNLATNVLLLQTLYRARQELLTTRQDFAQNYRAHREYPVFFDDLERRYDALRVDLQDHSKKLAALLRTPAFIRVQELRPRQPRPQPPVTGQTDPDLSGTNPPDATALLSILSWNINVYLKVADSGKETFTLTIVSLPSDATVSAKRIGEKYVTLGPKTTISQEKFPISLWSFKFTKENCREIDQDFDPINDASSTLQVELHCQR